MSSPANARDARSPRSARRPRCPCRSRPAAAARPRTGCATRRARAARARSAATPSTSSLAIGRGAPVQRDAHAALAFDDHARQPRVGFVGRGRDRVARTAAHADRPGARRRPSTPSRTARRTADPGTGSRLARNSTGRPLTIPTRPSRPDQPPRARRSPPGARRRPRDDRRSARAIRRSRRGARSRPAARRARRSLRRRRAQWDATGMDAKTAARETVGSNAQTLVGLSHRVHAHPELKFEETQSSAVDRGRARRRRARRSTPASATCPTAFSCRIGSGSLHLAICAEYDALPGHRPRVRPQHHRRDRGRRRARARAARRRSRPARSRVIGTPAEEGGGGKVFLLERGAFAGVHAAMMVHPAPFDDLTPRVQRGRALRRQLRRSPVARGGRARSSASTRPTRSPSRRSRSGCCASTSAPATRCTASSRTAATRANIVPAHTEGLWMVRAPTIADLAVDAAARRALLRGRRARDRRDARRSPTCRPSTRTWSTTTTSSTSTAPTRSRSAATPDDEHEMTFSTDMGNVSLRDPVDPPVHRDRERRRGEPSARVRGRVRERVGRPRGARRRARAGVDRDRPRDRPAPRAAR